MARTPDTGQKRERTLRFRASEAEEAEILAALGDRKLSDVARTLLLDWARSQ